MPRIQVIPPDEATGRLKEIYDEVKQKRGAIANVHAIHSLHPETMRTHIDFYMSVLYAKSGLSRQERETIAVAVSQANGCAYCVAHHVDALSRYQKDEGILNSLRAGQDHASLSERERAIISFARRLTLAPASSREQGIGELRSAELTDEEILMATLTAAYFNFVNRVVHCLGVEEEHQPASYNY